MTKTQTNGRHPALDEERCWEAVQARDALSPGATIAGGFAPPFTGNLKEEFENTSRVLAEAGVDWLLPEYMGGDTIHKSPGSARVSAADRRKRLSAMREWSSHGTSAATSTNILMRHSRSRCSARAPK